MTIRTSLPLAAIGCLLLFQPAFGGTRDDVVLGILRCAAIADDRAWLDCTYGAQQPMRAKLGLPPASERQQRLVPSPSAAPPSMPQPAYNPPQATYNPQAAYASPGPAPQAGRSASVGQIMAGTAPALVASTVAAFVFDKQNLFVVTLQNGQVWHQVNSQYQKAALKPGARVTIKPGALWSYNLQIDNGPAYKVERLK